MGGGPELDEGRRVGGRRPTEEADFEPTFTPGYSGEAGGCKPGNSSDFCKHEELKSISFFVPQFGELFSLRFCRFKLLSYK